MKVFKFGGASVNSVERIKNVAEILRGFPAEKILVVISAMGKTTNALEKVVEAFSNGKKDEALQLFEQVKQQHLTTAKYLLVTHYLTCEQQLKDFFLLKWNGCCTTNLFVTMITITTRWFVLANYCQQPL